MTWLTKNIQVNIPFSMLVESYIDRFIDQGINPEIGFDAKVLDGFSLSDFTGIAARLRDRGLTITFHAPFMDLSAGSPDPKIREVVGSRFEQIIQLVPIFKPKTVVCHIGYDEKRYWYVRDTWLENSLEIWNRLGERLKDYGSALMLENVYEADPEIIRVLFENLKKGIAGFCLDIGHVAVFSKAPIEIWMKATGSYIGQLHLHDNNGKQDEHLAPGMGNIDFPALFKALKVIKKEPPIITLEPHKEEYLLPGIEYLKRIWPW